MRQDARIEQPHAQARTLPLTLSFPRPRATAHTLDGQEIPGPLEPLANVLLVKVKDAADVSAGGIVLPDQVGACRKAAAWEPPHVEGMGPWPFGIDIDA